MPSISRLMVFALLISCIGCHTTSQTDDDPPKETTEEEDNSATEAHKLPGEDPPPLDELDDGNSPPSVEVAPHTSGITLPDDPEVAVITYNVTLGGDRGLVYASSGPTLIIYADGRMVVHDPYGRQTHEDPDPDHVPFIEAQMTESELLAIIDVIATPVFLESDSKAINTQIADEFGKWADDKSTWVHLQAVDVDHKLSIYALSMFKEMSPSLAVAHMSELDALFQQLVVDIIAATPR